MIKYPFEGTRHKATIIMLPYRKDIWLNEGKDARKVILEMAKIITKYEKLYLIAHDSIYKEAKEMFNLDNVFIIKMNYNDAWARDICPLFVVEDNKLKGISFDFNAWGGSFDGLYSDYEADRKVKSELIKYLNIEEVKIPFILEGGSINTDGCGNLLTTRACLLSKGRNPSYNEEEITNILKESLNLKNIIYLDNGIVEDETNEHVDNMAVFLDSKTIALAWSDYGLQHEYSIKAYNDLIALGYNVIKLPVPNPDLKMTEDESKSIELSKDTKVRLESSKLAASYINFYQSDKFILLPQFNVKEDELAYNILNDFYQGKKTIYKIQSRAILVSGGNIHCITMQIPEVKCES